MPDLPEIVTLRSGAVALDVCPSVGGAIARYWQDCSGGPIEWMRPTSAQDLAPNDPRLMACFPLLPFSGRIRDGRFNLGDRRLRLPLNFLPERHAIHGHGWQQRWQIVDQSADTLVIQYLHEADEWPWTYRAQQRFSLDQNVLSVSLTLANECSEAMPAGLGLHPYFLRTAKATLSGASDSMWHNDDEVMPLTLAEPPAGRRLAEGILVDSAALDNTYTNWRRRAEITWPEWAGAKLLIEAEPPVDFLVVFAPPGEGFFCAEPVSNIGDAFNLAAAGRSDTGMQMIEPGSALSASVRFRPLLAF